MHWLPVILILPYFFLLLNIYRSLLKIEAFKCQNDPSTFVSVVVACRNEQNNINTLLRNIAAQDYPKILYEVIIVDDNSSDKTFETASSFKELRNLIILRNEGTGKKTALYTGINNSSGKLIITTDADCRMGKNWIATITSFYEEMKPDMIICPVQIEPGTGFFAGFQELEFLSLQGITAGTAAAGQGTMCNGANLSFEKETYLKNAGDLHNEIASGDDVFLLHSFKKTDRAGILWLEAADSIVTAASSPTIGSFLTQRKRWISKAKVYNDRFTIILGIVTFVTIVLQFATFLAAIINQVYIFVFLTVFLLKSIPDFLILINTARRYRQKRLLLWFIPAQIVYPFYVLTVFFYSLISLKKRPNSPSPIKILF